MGWLVGKVYFVWYSASALLVSIFFSYYGFKMLKGEILGFGLILSIPLFSASLIFFIGAVIIGWMSVRKMFMDELHRRQ